MILIDGHLDLAYNATACKRDLTLELEVLRAREKRSAEEALITLPELQRAGMKIVFGTLFAMPNEAVRPPRTDRCRGPRYRAPQEAKTQAVEQLELYERWEESGLIRILRFQNDLEAHLSAKDGGIGLVILMEGADPVEPDELGWWVERGLRILGPAWQKTRYSGGTRAPGPLSGLGVELIHAMNEHGVVLDASHMAEKSFWQAMDLAPRHVIASHSNARALTDTDRHLTDAMIRAIGKRNGVIGLVLGNPFIKSGVSREHPKRSVTLGDVRAQAEYMAVLIGWDKIAIGSDFDGGFGVQETPFEIGRGADFSKLAEVAPEGAKAGLLGENWLRLLHRVLPEG